VKDRIGNELTVGDKVVVSLPESMTFGFIAEIKPMSGLANLRGNQASVQPGHILVSCVLALPCDPAHDAVTQVAKVYDASKTEEVERRIQAAIQPN
jgi:hypothetical protein